MLTSNGTSWVSSASGGAINVQTFTATGTWTKPASGTMCSILLIGGGGGGGRVTDGDFQLGGQGGYIVGGIFRLSDLGATVSVTIGSGASGSGSPTVAGGNGGKTMFGTFLTSYGGQGGTSQQSTAYYSAPITDATAISGSSAFLLVGNAQKATTSASNYGWIANQVFPPNANSIATGGGGGITSSGGQQQSAFGTGGSGTTSGAGGAGTGYGAGGGCGTTSGGSGTAGYCKVIVW